MPFEVIHDEQKFTNVTDRYHTKYDVN